jgi:hypothetical protein
MATNAIVGLTFTDLIYLAKECQTGANVLGPSIPLVINTGTAIGSDRANTLQAQIVYEAALSQLTPLGAALLVAAADARTFAIATKGWLENFYGRFWSQQWRQVGFENNKLIIPSREAALGTLVERMQFFLTENPTKANTALNVTAARAGVVWGALSTARTNYNAGKQLCATRKVARGAMVKGMQRRLRGLCNELLQAIGPDDPRWREFGLNIPASQSVPPAPKNVVVNNQLEGQFLITCDPATYAGMYRFFTKLAGEEEPVFRGHSATPMFHLTGLTPGTVYDVYVSASNESGESRFSAPVQAIVSGTASAAA